jgi:hypothetical protein
MQNHTHRLQSSLIHQNKVTLRPYLHDAICKITHTHTHTYYNHHWYTRTRLQCGHIFMTRYAKSHTHIDLACRSILLAGHRSCWTWSSNKLHFCWWHRDLIPGLQWDHKASWTYTFGLQEPFASGGIKHRKNNDHWTRDEFRQIVHPENNYHWT